MPRTALRCCSFLAVCGLIAAAAGPAAASTPPPSDVMRQFDVRLSLTMKSHFAFQPDPTGCNGTKPSGWSGAGDETIELRSPRPVRVSLFNSPGVDAVLNRKDLQRSFELAGETRRSGEMTHVVCGETTPGQAAPCVGRFPFRTSVELGFRAGDWTIQTATGPTTRDVVPGCGTKTVFDWDGAVARSGIVMLSSARGSAPYAKLRARSFTLEARTNAACTPAQFGGGTCATEWIYRANFRQVKRKRRRH